MNTLFKQFWEMYCNRILYLIYNSFLIIAGSLVDRKKPLH